jgi:alkylation response protein AidB-like acyl-CoA dehydrogenase
MPTEPADKASGSFLAELHRGRFRWDLIHPFVAEDPTQRAAADAAVADLVALLASRVDPDAVDLTRELPASLVPDLAAKGYLGMTVPRPDGGRGFPPYTTFRLLAAASAWSGAVGLLLAVHNGLSPAAYLAALEPGPLRDHIAARLATGAVFGVADTEPSGAANASRQTVATPVDGGRGYLLTGEKVFIGNGRIAGLLAVTAALRDGAREVVELFVVDTTSPGFTVLAPHDFLGLGGAPSAALRLDRVYVPAEHRLVTAEGGWRASPLVEGINALARMYIAAAPALGVARRCLDWSRDFVARRRVDGRSLGGYQAIQRLLAASLADVFALESVAQWCLLGDQSVSRRPERTAAKNIGTALGWRVVERTMSLYAAEGLETAASKARRGAPPAPVERALRDLRAMRIAGGVDFHIDLRAARHGIFASHYARLGHADAPETESTFSDAGRARPPDLASAHLSPANVGHVRFACATTARLARHCAELASRYPADALAERQPTLIAVNRLVDEVFTMSVTLARAARLAVDGVVGAQQLADVYSESARARIAARWLELERPPTADYAYVSREWLAGRLPADALFADVTGTP